MRILLAGEWQADIHEAAWASGLEALGHAVLPFGWFERFGGNRTSWSALVGRVQGRLLWGPALARLNWELIRLARRERPDVLLLYRGTHILPAALRALRRFLPDLLIATYNNDDPFSLRAARGLWRHYLGAVRLADVNLAYRPKSVEDLSRFGARDVQLVRSAFLPDRDRPLELSEADHLRLDTDVVFAGHFEPDGRLDFLEALSQGPWRLRLFGPDWEHAPRIDWLDQRRPIEVVRGPGYVKAIQCAKVALCFLSTLNNDTYTRRCFEIPAIGTLLLCQRSADMERLFAPGREADYFGSPAELRAKLELYLGNAPLRARVAAAGHTKVWAAGHDIVSRMREVERALRDGLDRKRQRGEHSS